MHFSGTSGRLYIRKFQKYVADYPRGDWSSVDSYKRYVTSSPTEDRFNDPENFMQVANVTNWSLNGQQDVIDCSTLGDTDRVFEAGMKSATGQCRILYYSSLNALGDAADRGRDPENSINKLAARFFKISKFARENGGPGVVSEKRSYDDGVGSKADPFLFRFLIEDDPNNSVFVETPPENSSNNINIDFWAHITAFNMSVAVGEVLAADLSFQCIGCPIISDL